MKTKNLLLATIMAFFVMSATAQTWNCGFPNETHVTATLSDSTLVISGTGQMVSYNGSANYPWASLRNYITQIVMEEGVTSIGVYAFYSSKNLTSVSIPSSMTSIDDNAFYGCSSLETVVIPNNVTSIGATAFYDCSALTSVTVSDNLKDVAYDSFRETPWYNNLLDSLPDGPVFIGKVLCDYKGTVPAVFSIPDGTLGIGSIFGVYALDNSNVTSIIIPNSVSHIGNSALAEIFNLTSLTIGWGVTYIDNYAFSSDGSLETVTVLNPYPEMITLGKNIFAFVELENCTLKVPAGSIERYKNAPVWQDFGDIIEGDGGDVDFPNLENLVVSSGTLSPEFNPSVYSYTMTVPNSVTDITLTATPMGNTTVSGDGSKTLAVGENTFTILVTTKNGQNTYTVKVIRLATDHIFTFLSASDITTYYQNVSDPIVSGYSLKFQLTTGQYSGNFPLNFDLALNGSKKTVNTNVPVEPNSIYEFTFRINLSNPDILTITTPIDGLGNPGTPYINDYDFHPCSVVISEGLTEGILYSSNVGLPWALEDASIVDFAFIGRNITSIKELGMTPTIKIFPNPATDYISVSGLQNNETLRFYSLEGQLILTQQTSGETENIAIDHFPAGVYFVKTDKGQTLKWIKK